MNPNNNDYRQEIPQETTQDRSSAFWAVAISIVLGVAGLSYGLYSMSRAEKTEASLAAQAPDQRQMAEMQQQVQEMRIRLMAQDQRERELSVALAEAEQAAAERKKAAVQSPPVRRAVKPAPQRTAKAEPAKPAPEDPRITDLQKKVAEQDEKLAGTQRLVEQARTDLEGRIDSTSLELSGSIAKTSDEVAELRRRGERDYFEFDILKSKQMSSVGPLRIALRKADVKRKRYNLDMLVDDNKLEKKNVNLYEPVYVMTPEWGQPVELLVNKVTKDRVAGYISVPKHKKTEVSLSKADPARLTPRETAQVQ
jgi:DNA polymerase III gamma/tau subunit